MANGILTDPYPNFNFLVELDGITTAAFQRMHGLRFQRGCDRVQRGRQPVAAQDPRLW